MDGTTTRGTWRRWGARLLSLLALAAVLVALALVIGGSLGPGGTSKGDAKPGERREQAQTRGAASYVVQPGDNLSAIAASAGLSEERLQELNPDVDPQALQSGETLRLRAG